MLAVLAYRDRLEVPAMTMAIHLTEQRRQAIDAQQSQPVEVVDPAHEPGVRPGRRRGVRAGAGAAGAAPAAAAALHAEIAPRMLQSMQAFWRDLPELLKLRSRQRRYVAY